MQPALKSFIRQRASSLWLPFKPPTHLSTLKSLQRQATMTIQPLRPVHGPCSRAVNTDREHWWCVPAPVNTGRVEKSIVVQCFFPTRPVTRVVCTENPCTRAVLAVDQPIRMFMQFSAALADVYIQDGQ